jgi:membrane-bound ClpP family serine protease
MVNGESWNAVALGGEAIANGECVEVISRKGLTLYVDRLPVQPGSTSSDRN